MPVLVALNDAKNILFRDHLSAVGAGCRLTFVRRYLIDALCLAAASAKSAEIVWHAPDAVLIGYKDVVVPPSEAVGFVEVLDVTVDPGGVPAAIVAQQREVTGALFGHQDVAVGQNEQTSRIDEPSRKRRRREARRYLRRLPAIGDDERPIGDYRAGLWRRQVGRVDVKTPTDLVLG